MTTESANLRICCYGSSSSATPEAFLNEAYSLGKVLAERNHVCVNGGGKNGCMGKMNDGCNDHGGTINAVIHEMFVLDGAEYLSASQSSGRHSLIVTKGPNLKERKEKLVENCDGIIVLPGGTGTFDELFEMVSQRCLGIFTEPIVCVSVDGFYDDVERLLKRAEKDKLLHVKAEDCVKVVRTSEEAVEWIEAQHAGQNRGAGSRAKARKQNKKVVGDNLRTLALMAVGFVAGVIYSRRKL